MIHRDGAELLLETTVTNTKGAVLTKADLIEEVFKVLKEVSRKEAAVIVERMLDSMVRALQRGDYIQIRGFGSFGTRQRRARIGRNPKTGASVAVLPKKIPYFKASRDLCDRVNKT